MIHPLFTVDMLRRLHVFPSKQWDPYIKTFSTLSGVWNLCWILLQLYILCTSAVKRNCDKNYNSPFTWHLFSSVSEFIEAKNLPSSRSDLNLVNFLLWRALQQKFYHQDLRDLDHLKHVLLHWWVRIIRTQ